MTCRQAIRTFRTMGPEIDATDDGHLDDDALEALERFVEAVEERPAPNPPVPASPVTTGGDSR
jgi:hypothetical protein